MKKILSTFFLTYLRWLAKIQLLKNQSLVIGITGTAGKTSARNAVAAILKNEYQIKVSYKANSETGIPLNLLGLTAHDYSLKDWLRLCLLAPIKLLTNWGKYQIYVVEMAIDSPLPPKNMDYLLKIIQPDIGIFLNAKPMHSLGFDQLLDDTVQGKDRREQITQLIAQEKGKLITQLPQKGLAVLNFDDANVKKFTKQTRAEVIGFGHDQSAQVKFTKYQPSLKGTKFTFEFNQEKQAVNFDKYLLPRHYGQTFAAGIAVGVKLDISFKQCLANLKNNFKLPPGRSSLISAVKQAMILDSSYNSSAQPTLDSLELLNQVALKRKLALLGDMRELGQVAKPEHELVALKAAQTCDLVVMVGPLTKKYIVPILEKNNVEHYHCQNTYQAAKILKEKLEKDDLLLVKGSQNTLLLEIAVERLMKDKTQVEELLCRRGKYWDQKRAKLKILKK
ncbi:MAG: Mur ligase family protein [Patescibacteria group bacterium]|nr:Mur ligase family protein [Patescibacteria group bacterium]